MVILILIKKKKKKRLTAALMSVMEHAAGDNYVLVVKVSYKQHTTFFLSLSNIGLELESAAGMVSLA